MVAMKQKGNDGNEAMENSDNKAKGSGSYKQLMVLKRTKKSGGDSPANCCVIRSMYID